ncbi:putative transcriptional regulator, AsnC family [Desulfurococcus mucosus DSM 2162]|uniref:Putative transcriptional regulator, AsnC family n=1 Tax=Desulfurococcus mucosus (strain ATCC 35584 / DSM 2162 / JCM 9187 / O7/1) TaxID=765177 RepID=E8R7U3_DESM0|nr:winged helix-turn-helix domain-containing protein [Desulfurococcus mucosus]ADV64569.1 putative transcriptional regulator, AsnC family [Desulfurococcus mucosus DSM 2162]
MSDKTASEKETALLKYLLKHSGQEIYQSQLSKELGVDPKVVSRILIKLEKAGVVERTPVTYEGRKTFLVKPVRDKLVKAMEDSGIDPYTLREAFDTVADIPCVKCPYIYKCYEGGYYDPATCQWLTEYLKTKAAAPRTLAAGSS